MPSEMEFVNYKDFVKNLTETESPTSADKFVVSNPTNGPRSMPGSAKGFSTAATEDDLVAGNYFTLDVVGGKKKLPADIVSACKIIDRGNATVATIDALTFKQNGWSYCVTDSGTLNSGALPVIAGEFVVWNKSTSKWIKDTKRIGKDLFKAVSDTSFSYSRISGKVFYPDIDTSGKTIDFGGDFVIRSRGKVKTITTRSVSIVDANNSAKHQLLLYSFNDDSFRIIAYNGSANDDEVFVGIINVNNNYDYIGAWFPFSVTIDGTTELAEAQNDIVDLEYFVGKVQNDTNSFKVIIDDIADADDTGDGFISANTLSFSSNANLHTLYFNNNGYDKLFCHTGHANDQVSVITFYAIVGSDKYPIGSVRSVGENNHDYFAVVPENCDYIAISYRTDGSYTDKFTFSLVRTMATKLQCNKSGYNRVSVDVSTPITWHKKAANRIAGCIDNVVPLSKCVINLDVSATIQYALRQMDSSGTLIKDSGWKTGQNEFVIQRNAVLVDIWARNPDNSDFSNDDIATMQSNFSELDFVVFDFSDETAGMSFVREVQEFTIGASKKIIRNVAHQEYSITSRPYGYSRI